MLINKLDPIATVHSSLDSGISKDFVIPTTSKDSVEDKAWVDPTLQGNMVIESGKENYRGT